MRPRLAPALVLAGALLGLVALVAAVAAAGNGGPDKAEAAIRTRSGLDVAALMPTAQEGKEEAAAPAPGAPGAATDIAKGGGVAFPDIYPFPYAPAQQSFEGITVQGYGSATADADAAVLELYFGSKVTGIEPMPVPESRTEPPSSGAGISGTVTEFSSEQPSQPITEADLQPVVDAIVAQGVSPDDLEVIITSYDPYYSSATIRVTVRNLDSVRGIVDAATNAAAGLANAQLQGTNVVYTVADCAALERAAMQASVDDARKRGAVFAEVLGVGLGPVVGAANYSYSPYGGTPCGSGYGGPVPLAGGVTYAEGQASQVQLVATVTVTFAIQ